jgi:hypothetical protein
MSKSVVALVGCGKIAKAAGERRTSRKVGCCGPGKRAGFGLAAGLRVRCSGLLDFGKPAISGKTSVMKTWDLRFGTCADLRQG